MPLLQKHTMQHEKLLTDIKVNQKWITALNKKFNESFKLAEALRNVFNQQL